MFGNPALQHAVATEGKGRFNIRRKDV